MAVVSPPTEHPPLVSSAVSLDEPRRFALTLEHLLYIAIGALSVLLHLYALGDRALHHDETLHAYYSWRIYQGQGYQHDPLLHGPFLYYITALTYLIFGDSDFTARLSAAAFGIVLTLLPWLLRRDMGRGAALTASLYLVLSPVVLYVGRFIRHDIYAVVFELLSVIAIARYVATERPLWHYVLAASMALMLVTIETFFLFLAIIGAFVVLWLLWQIARHTLWLLLGYAAIAGVAVKIVPRWAGPLPLPTSDQALAVRHQPDNNWGEYFRKVGEVLGPMLAHPSVMLLLLATIGLIGVLVWTLFFQRTDGRTIWQRARSEPQGTLGGAIARIPGRQWGIAFGIAFVIYLLFFTGVLSTPTTPNTTALVTGVSGSLLYWLGQHGVQRGNQPLHYYLFELSVYEPLLLVLGLAGIALVIRGMIRFRDRLATIFVPAMLAWWSLGALALYSWAGEKMPWLTIHMALPLTMLSAWALARLWRWATRLPFDRVAIGLTGLGGVWLLFCFNRFNTLIRYDSTVGTAAIWPLLGTLFIVLMLAGVWVIYRSPRPALLSLLALTLSFGMLFTLRSSMRLNFRNGDIPVEPLVFVQTSPDVAQMLRRLEQASLLRTGKLDLPIRHDNETIWDWYLRNYTRKDGSDGTTIGPIDDQVQVVLLLSENVPANEADLDGFVRQELPLRWWLPECEVYRLPASDTYCGAQPNASSLLSRFLSKPWDGQALADYWQFWFDRKLPTGLGSTNWTIFVRPELAAEFGISGGDQ